MISSVKFIKTTMLFTILSLSSFLLSTTRDSVSGIWDQPEYIIDSDILILPGDTLLIESGVSVKFDGNHEFEINGSLIVMGTQDSVVTFESYQEEGTWRGMKLISLRLYLWITLRKLEMLDGGSPCTQVKRMALKVFGRPSRTWVPAGLATESISWMIQR